MFGKPVSDGEMLALGRALVKAYQHSLEEDGDLLTAYILLTIHVSHMEGKQLDVTGIAYATRLPRTTVARRLNEYSGPGTIEWVRDRRRRIPVWACDRDIIQRYYIRLRRIFLETCRDLNTLHGVGPDW